MDIQHYQALLDQAESQLLALSDTVAHLNQAMQQLIEENNQLRIDQHRIRTSILANEAADGNTDVPDQPAARPMSGRESLQNFYDEGIHVCHEFFGSRILPDEECLFCQEVIKRLQ